MTKLQIKLFSKLRNVIYGMLIYAAGDTTASLILNEFSYLRMLGMMFVGASYYAFEIPLHFYWIERITKTKRGFYKSIKRTILAFLYFNPVWIARHILFIKAFSGNFDEISFVLFKIGLLSFIANIPITLPANYFIQNKIPFKWRFVTSSIFSALMAVYYALSSEFFN